MYFYNIPLLYGLSSAHRPVAWAEVRWSELIDLPQLVRFDPEIPLESLVGGVHGGPFDLLWRGEFPQGEGCAVPGAAIEVNSLHTQIAAGMFPPFV